MARNSVYVIRVPEVELDTDGHYRYHQLETNEKFGPFPSVASMCGHIHDIMMADIIEAITRQYH
jgi:hypothetical protein